MVIVFSDQARKYLDVGWINQANCIQTVNETMSIKLWNVLDAHLHQMAPTLICEVHSAMLKLVHSNCNHDFKTWTRPVAVECRKESVFNQCFDTLFHTKKWVTCLRVTGLVIQYFTQSYRDQTCFGLTLLVKPIVIGLCSMKTIYILLSIIKIRSPSAMPGTVLRQREWILSVLAHHIVWGLLPDQGAFLICTKTLWTLWGGVVGIRCTFYSCKIVF